MASRITYPYAKEVENTCRKLKKTIAERRQGAKERRFVIVENPESREQKKSIGYVIQLTEQPQKNKKEDWEISGDCGYIKSAKRNRKDLTALSGRESRSKNVKGPSGDHSSRRSTKKETSCQTSATTKYVKISPEMIHQNEIMLSKLKRNEELLQQIKKHKEMIHLLKNRIRNPVSASADEKKQNEENQVKSKHEVKHVQTETKHREKLVRKKEAVQKAAPSGLKARNLRSNALPDIKEYPEPGDATSIQSIMCRLMQAAPVGMDKRNAVRTMYGTTIKKLSWNTKHERPSSPRHLAKNDMTYVPLSVIKPNVTKKGTFGSQKIPTLKPVINFKLLKTTEGDRSFKPRQNFPFVC